MPALTALTIQPLITDPSLHFNLRYAIGRKLNMLSDAGSTALLAAHPFTLLVSCCPARALLHSRPARLFPHHRSLLSAGIPLRLTRNMELKGIPHEGRRQLDNRQRTASCRRGSGERANMTAANGPSPIQRELSAKTHNRSCRPGNFSPLERWSRR